MRSEFRFFMHPDDERSFEEHIRDAEDVEVRDGQLLPEGGIPLQFTRSRTEGDVMTEGRIAIASSGFGLEAESLPEERLTSEGVFRRLRTHLKKHYRNGLIRWVNAEMPSSHSNPGPPDKKVWVGPAALSWWRASRNRELRQFISGSVSAYRG